MDKLVKGDQQIEVYNVDYALTANEVKARSQLIQQVMDAIMKVETHYGTIPGTNKPTLYKAGADQLGVTFKMAPSYIVEDLSHSDAIRYRIICNLNHHDGTFLGSGVGEASTDEDKYKWRLSLKEEWDETPSDRKRVKWKKGYNKPNERIEQIRTEPADLANTILKMAKKRAHIDATLTATGASDIFAQDLEDGPANVDEVKPKGTEVGKKANAAQIGRLHTIRSKKGVSKEHLEENLKKKFDYTDSIKADLMPITIYNQVCEGLEKMDDKESK